MLDIFVSEVTPANSFEQLCINRASRKGSSHPAEAGAAT